MNKKSAFTLIELSIVLVIASLLAGGILVGRDMLEIAQAQRQISQLQETEVAMNTFRLKYNCLPGDCKNAAGFGLGTSGNGDKKLPLITGNRWNGVSTDFANSAAVGEMQLFWVHLSRAKLIKEKFNIASSVIPHDDSNNCDISLDPYFPKDKVNKYYLTPITLNNQTFISSGLICADRYRKLRIKTPVFTTSQTKYMHEKINGDDFIHIDDTPNHFYCFNLKKRMYPTVEYAGSGFVCANVVSGPGATIPNNRCVQSDGAGGYRYSKTGFCNILYKLDY